MRYSVEVIEQAKNLYQGGTTRRQIAEQMKIPLSTIRSWTKDIVSATHSAIKCAQCGKTKRTPNIQTKYCSTKCKNKANYLRRRKKERPASGGPSPHRICQYCGKQYQPAHPNAKSYCSKNCRIDASNQRRKQRRDQSHIQAERQQFLDSMNAIRKARQEALNLNIDKEQYRQEINIIEAYYHKHRYSPAISEREDLEIQQIFKM